MKHLKNELATLLLLLIIALLTAWLTQGWVFVGWFLAAFITSRMLLSLWIAERWLYSGGRKLNYLLAGSLSELLCAATQLLEKERRLSQQLLGRARYFKYAAQALPEGVLALDSNYAISWFNKGAIDMLGLSRCHRGQPIERVLRLPELLALVKGEDFGVLEIPSPTNGQCILAIEVTSFMQGQQLLIIRDITTFKRSDAIRRDFVANASHELRTPLTVMQGYVEMMLDTPSSHADHWHRPLEQMHNQSERMRKIVDDMLVLSRLEGNDAKLKIALVNVPFLLEQIADEAKQLSGVHHHYIELILDSLVCLMGHEEYLRSAFTNLVSNAVRYTPDGGTIKIHWWQDAQGAHLSVTDTGIGIAAEHLPRIMERFYRVDSARSRATGGTGLGLAITRNVLERHNATLTIESEIGLGSCFTCNFPLILLVDLA